MARAYVRTYGHQVLLVFQPAGRRRHCRRCKQKATCTPVHAAGVMVPLTLRSQAGCSPLGPCTAKPDGPACHPTAEQQ